MVSVMQVNQAVKEINGAITSKNEEVLLPALCKKAARLSGVSTEIGSWYMKVLGEKREIKELQVLIIASTSRSICLPHNKENTSCAQCSI